MLKEKQETGRSMIEMLGVLAIIGVLSVGGIAGYTSAMNKHRANELLHQVSMRANVCRAQLVSGNTNLSVDDFGAYDGYTFTPSYDATNKKYSITVTAPTGKTISKVVCNNMKNALPSTVEMTTPETCADNNTITLTYVDDVSSSSAESVATCTPACQANEECVNGTCLPDADGASCMNNMHLCVGTNAPYCVVQYTNGNLTFTCQKNPMDYIDDYNNTLCGEGFSGCGDLYCGPDNLCHSSLENVPCTVKYECAGSDAPYCQPTAESIAESGASYAPWGQYSYKCSTEAKRAHCDTNADCGDGYFCHSGYLRCCSSTNPESWCLDT